MLLPEQLLRWPHSPRAGGLPGGWPLQQHAGQMSLSSSQPQAFCASEFMNSWLCGIFESSLSSASNLVSAFALSTARRCWCIWGRKLSPSIQPAPGRDIPDMYPKCMVQDAVKNSELTIILQCKCCLRCPLAKSFGRPAELHCCVVRICNNSYSILLINLNFLCMKDLSGYLLCQHCFNF